MYSCSGHPTQQSRPFFFFSWKISWARQSGPSSVPFTSQKGVTDTNHIYHLASQIPKLEKKKKKKKKKDGGGRHNLKARLGLLYIYNNIVHQRKIKKERKNCTQKDRQLSATDYCFLHSCGVLIPPAPLLPRNAYSSLQFQHTVCGALRSMDNESPPE